MLLDKWGQPFRNDESQRLMNKYQEICKAEGLNHRDGLILKLRERRAKGEHITIEALSMAMVLQSHTLARELLESSEFRPLAEWWIRKEVDPTRQAGLYQRLVDLGALDFQRALTGLDVTLE